MTASLQFGIELAVLQPLARRSACGRARARHALNRPLHDNHYQYLYVDWQHREGGGKPYIAQY